MLRLCASRLTSLAANARLEHTRLFATPSDTPRVMLVFGASGGIGAALVKALARDNPGAALILADSNGKGLEALKSEVQGSKSETHTVDAADTEQVEGLVQGVLQRHKRLDAVANVVGNVMLQPAGAAGGHNNKGNSSGATLSELHQSLAVNLVPAFNILQASAKAMAASGGGSIVLTSAAVAETGVPGFEVFSAAKAGVEGLMRSAAASYALKGVRINAVAPGLTRTAQTSNMMEGKPGQTAVGTHPVHRVGEPKDIAEALAFFMHPRTDFITGQVLAVDGGLSTLTKQQQA
ncbi:hypothetical protein V8C86DRAFT_3140004 [Haematococcus lacustris]